MRDGYQREDFERLQRGKYCGTPCQRCASLRVHHRMQPRFVVTPRGQVYRGYTLGWSCEVCGHVWYE